MRIRVSIAMLLAGCPLVEEVGEKPEGTTTSDVESDESESSSSSSSGDATDTDDAPLDGPIDCALVAPEGEVLGGGPIGEFGFPPPCSPRRSGAGDYMCCSDDPAAVGGELPAYQGKSIDGTVPIFSAGNNPIGTSGLCVRTSDIPPGSGLLEAQAENCPIPCNPTWNEGETSTVCGANRVCCQTRPLELEDCIFDEELQLWRPVNGDDIPSLSNWANGLHATHQDPGGSGCTVFAGGDQTSEAFGDCVAQLTVADQRGFCMALSAGQLCPHAAPGFLDACMQINMGLVPPPR
jgi:hypothetical protein